MSKVLSTWAVAASHYFASDEKLELYKAETGAFSFQVYAAPDSIWIAVSQETGAQVMFRAAFSHGGHLMVQSCSETANGVDVVTTTPSGKQTTHITINKEIGRAHV